MSMRPNVILIFCDELRTDAVRCYPHTSPRPKTPHLERLAERGVVFENCFCSSPICVASRTSMLTSTHCETHGVYANEGVWPGFEGLPDLLTWPEVFAEAGYATATFGKHHVPKPLLRWDRVDPTGGGMRVFDPWLPADDPSIIRCAGVQGGRYPADAPYPPGQVTDRGLDWIGNQRGPWLCRFSYLQPHTPVYPPAWAVALHEDDPLIHGRLEPPGDVSAFEKRFAEIIDAQRLTRDQVRMSRVYYHALATWVDTQVGRIIDWLDDRGQTDDTIIAFEADHGAALGDGGRYAKHVFAPDVHRVPRIIASPGRIAAGHRRADICDSLDLGPTLLGLAGVPVAGHAADQFKGRDLFTDPEPQAVFATIGHGHRDSRAFPNGGRGAWDDRSGWPRRTCVRTRQCRLDRNERLDDATPSASRRDVFLADWCRDPAERRNLAGDPAFADLRDELTRWLDAHVAASRETVAPRRVAGKAS